MSAAIARMAVIEHSYHSGRAYRDGALVCARAGVALMRDARIAPEPPVPSRIRVCFVERLNGALRHELEQLVRARGARGRRLAETLAPVEIVWDESSGERRVVGHLEPPEMQRHGPLAEISFPLRERAGADQTGVSTEGSARKPSPPAAPTSEPSAPGRLRPCARCRAPAVYYHLDTGDDLCQACGIYIAGQQHGKAASAREQLTGAIAELLAVALTREHIETMADGELEGVKRPTGPDIAHPEDPRPWVGYLLDPLP